MSETCAHGLASESVTWLPKFLQARPAALGQLREILSPLGGPRATELAPHRKVQLGSVVFCFPGFRRLQGLHSLKKKASHGLTPLPLPHTSM